MDVFGDPELFAEFEKPREPSDRLLMETLKDSDNVDSTKKRNQKANGEEKGENDHAKSGHGSMEEESGESENDDEDDENGEEMQLSDSAQEAQDENETEDDPSKDLRTSKTGKRATKRVSDNKGSEDTVIGDLRREIERLKKENIKMRRQRRIVEPSRFQDEEGPAIQVVFMNHKIARKHKSEVEDFFLHLLTKDEGEEYEGKVLVPNIRSNSVCLVDEAENETDMELKTYNIMTCTAIGCTQLYKEFIVDAMGWPLVEGNPSMSEGWEHPLYSQTFTNALPYEDEDVDDGPGNPRSLRPKKACFNCGEEHDLRDCTIPKDFNKINQRKREFMNAKAASQQPKLQRYIRDGKDQPQSRFDSFKPGVIGSSLREALGIRENQLPPYIYQMRLLGYPPGHMMDSQVDESGISMFDKHGKEVGMDGGEGEDDGEVENKDTSVDLKPGQYDASKLIRYPGFNVEIPEDTIDEHQRLGMPPMRQEHGIEVLEMFLSQQNTSGTKRQLSDNGSPGSAKRQKTGSHTNDEESHSERKKLKAKRSNPRVDSPSMEELQERSSQIQQELAMELEGNQVGAGATGDAQKESDDDTNSDPAMLSRQDTSLVKSDSFSTSSLSVSHGTPIHKNSSGKRDSLPMPEKWRKDITEHIPFENLPGTTGNYERMNSLLGKHRKDRKSLTPKSASAQKSSS